MATAVVLRPFGLVPSMNGQSVFDSSLIHAARRVREVYQHCDYDHRPELPERDRVFPYLLTDHFRVGYACFKYAVSKVIQPQIICEIGIGAGMGALAFLAASPSAHYLGIDDGSKSKEDDFDFLGHVAERLKSHAYSFDFKLLDSLAIERLPYADLFHVDGGHDYDHAHNDMRLALNSGSEWILVDDARDIVVSAAAFHALHQHIGSRGGYFEWAYFEDTWTGNFLFHRL